MAEIKRSRLDLEGIAYRENEIPGKNRYEDQVNPYDENNDDAMYHGDKDHPWGKRTGKSMGYAIRDLTAPKTQISYKNFDTKNAGGSYDIYGTKGVDKAFQGDSGREFLSRINEYNEHNAYGRDSVEIDLSVRGQYFN